MTAPKRTTIHDKVFSIAASSVLVAQADWAAARRGIKRGEWIRMAMIEAVRKEQELDMREANDEIVRLFQVGADREVCALAQEPGGQERQAPVGLAGEGR